MRFILELEKMLDTFTVSYQREKKGKRRLKNRIDFLNEVRKFPSLPNTLKATKVEVTFITFVVFCSDSILLHS